MVHVDRRDCISGELRISSSRIIPIRLSLHIFGMRIRLPSVLYLDVGRGPWDVEAVGHGPCIRPLPEAVQRVPRDTNFLSRLTGRNYLCNIAWSQGILYRLLGRLLRHLRGGRLCSYVEGLAHLQFGSN